MGIKKNKLLDYIVVGILIGMVSIGLYKNTKDKKLLKEFELTKGTITKFKYCNYSYCAEYEYVVNGKKHIGTFVASYFECPDKSKGCLGKEFNVKYSIKKPNISEIDLEKYNINKNYKPSLN
ncbi:hypothetical protein EVU94_03960 [Flavobacteriaceae bacterium 144Ye]|nr:hypothetical protein EVU94_03960 [Flavobacteriaceae bacterium 144Ye]